MTDNNRGLGAECRMNMDGYADQRISFRVIEAVAEVKGEDSMEMRPPLFEAINPEALDAVFQSGSISISFEWDGYTIEIDGSGSIAVQETE